MVQRSFFQICDNLLGASHIRLGYDLDKRHPASVVVNQGAVFPLIMNQLTCILLHMHLVDTYGLFACGSLDLNGSVIADWQIQLRDLVVLRIIRVKIVLTVKLAVLMDMAVCRKTCLDGKLYHFLLRTGRDPGIPVQTGQVCVFGAPPNSVEHPQKIFVFVASSTCTSVL